MEISSYYQESVELGKQFQKLNKSWDGKDTFSYHRQIRDIAHFYGCKTVLDYGCGKGNQWIETVPFWPEVEPKNFKQYLGIDSVYQYDPCVEQFEQAPPDIKFDLVICNQVLPYIPDQDLVWLKQRLMQYTGKVCFIGMHSQTPKAKKQIYDKTYFSIDRTQQWYQTFFEDWQGSQLHWWFRNRPYQPDWINNDIN